MSQRRCGAERPDPDKMDHGGGGDKSEEDVVPKLGSLNKTWNQFTVHSGNNQVIIATGEQDSASPTSKSVRVSGE